jgi:DNA polymerase III epsilon subunit-like protein
MSITALLGRYLRRFEPHGRWNGFLHTPLDRLPMVAIDCETTGLNPRRDRIISFAAVRIEEGLKVAERPMVDLLIDPGVDIPPRTVAVHGLDRHKLAGAPSFGDIFPSIIESMADAVVVGHFVGFDLAIIGREAMRAGRSWHEPPSFDTADLAAAMGHAPDHFDLAELLGRLGIEHRGHRHTAAADARMAAQLFVSLAHRLIGHGRGTYGGVAALRRQPRH